MFSNAPLYFLVLTLLLGQVSWSKSLLDQPWTETYLPAAEPSATPAPTPKSPEEQAIADSNMVLEFNPRDPDSYLQRANAYAKLGKFDKSEADFQKGLKIAPTNPNLLNGHGLALARQKKFDAALGEFNKAITAKPDYASAHYNRGLVYAATDRDKEAIADFTAALGLSPRDGDSFGGGKRERG